MSLNIGSPAGSTIEAKVEWCVQALKTIERYMVSNEIGVITDAFTTDDPDGVESAPVTELEVTVPDLTNVVEVLATMIEAFRKRGSKGS